VLRALTALRRSSVPGPLLAIAVSAGLYALAFPPFGHAWVAWVCLAPLIPLWERARPLPAALLGLAHGTLISLTTTPWLVLTLRDYFGRSGPWAALLLTAFGVATLGLYHAPAFAALAASRRRLPRGVWLALIPAAWVVVEWARSSLGLRCPWEKLGDAFWSWPRLRELVSVTGVYGLTALAGLANVALAETVRAIPAGLRGRFGPARSAATWALAFTLALAFASGFGAVPAAQATEEPERLAGDNLLRVAIVQGNIAPRLRWQRSHASRVLRRYAGLTRRELRAGRPPDLILWPEQALQTSLDDPAYGPPLRAFLASLSTPLLFGAPRQEGHGRARRIYNSAFLSRPGAAPLVYDKRRLVPFSETHPWGRRFGALRGDLDVAEYRPGREPGLFHWNGPTLGVLICFEAIYPEMARELARGGARVLVNLSNDGWFLGRGGQEQHLAQVVLRAVETGLPVVRATTTGISAVISPDGTLRAQLGRDRQGVLQAAVAAPPRRLTPYVRLGDAFAAACTGTWLLALGAAARRRRPSNPPSP